MRKLSKLLFLILFLCSSVCLFAQPNGMLKQYLTVENGLSHNEVTAIVQDLDGFIWIGTRGGLSRYDGYELKVYNQKPGDSNSLVNPSIETLFVDSKGNIWIGTKSGGVSQYNPKNGQFTNIVNNYQHCDKAMPANRVLTFFEDSEGKIWIGTWAWGLFVYDVNTNSTKQYLKGQRIASITSTSDKRIFVGSTVPCGLFEYDKASDSFRKIVATKSRQIIYDQPRNVLWIVGGDNVGAGSDKKGLTKLDLRNNKITQYGIDESKYNRHKLPHSYYALHLDNEGKVWIGTWGTGLYVFNPNDELFERRFIYPEEEGSFNRDYDAVLDIFEDQHHNIWLGTNGGGVCVLSAKLGFNSLGYNRDKHSGLNNTRVMSVLEDKNDNLWIGTIGDGLFWSPNREKYYEVHNPALNNEAQFFVIKYLYQDNAGTIWVGTNLGVYIIEFNENKPVLVLASKKYNANVLNETVVSFIQSDGMFWLGTLSEGLYLVDDQTYKVVKNIRINNKGAGSIASDRISCILKDSRDRIWLGTYNGLHIYNPVDTTVNIAEESFQFSGEFTGNIITSIDEDQRGNIWIGTPNGLNRISQTGAGKFEVSYFTEKDGLASNFIKGIACDQQGNIWFSSNSGISKYAANENRFINFDESDGVRGRNFTESSVCKNTKGELFFGGTRGLTYFNPEEIIEHKLALKPVFTELKVLNQVIEVGKKYDSKIILDKAISRTNEIVLSYHQNKLELKLSALDFVSHGTNNYEFILENSDTEWNHIGTRRFIVFNDLAPGEYTLKVRSSNRHNIWSEEIAQLKITINPPIWSTWYALLIYVFIAIFIISIIRWNAVKQVRLAASLEMEKVHHEQDQKMSEMKLRFFTNISHEFRTPLTLILAPLKEILTRKAEFHINEEFENKLAIIQNNSLRLMRMVNQLLDFRKVESGNMKLFASLGNLEDFVDEVGYSFRELAHINNIAFSIKSALKTKEIWFDRDKLEIVLNNLISNSFKYLKDDGKIEVSLYEEEDEVLLSVSDNGPGIPALDIKHIFDRFYQIEKKDGLGGSGIGLALSKRFVELHSGSISVTSEPSVNTEFVVTLPKGKTHLKPEEMVVLEAIEPMQVKKDTILSQVLPAKSKAQVQSDVCILVVDDNIEIRNYLLHLLAPFYCVETAENGLAGIEKVKSLKPKLIISDVMMPEIDGFEFCKRVRSKEASSITPFIFLTAKSNEKFRLLGAQAGANDYISKPFDPHLLLEKVKHIIDRQQKMEKQYSKSVRLEPSDIVITSGEEEFITKVIAIIEANLQNDKFSSEMLAAELSRSYSSLYRKLKRLTGCSAAEFIRSIRIKRAGQLLSDREKAISEIAFEVGFNDVKHFRTVFQKHFGCSPSKYRDKL